MTGQTEAMATTLRALTTLADAHQAHRGFAADPTTNDELVAKMDEAVEAIDAAIDALDSQRQALKLALDVHRDH